MHVHNLVFFLKLGCEYGDVLENYLVSVRKKESYIDGISCNFHRLKFKNMKKEH